MIFKTYTEKQRKEIEKMENKTITTENNEITEVSIEEKELKGFQKIINKFKTSKKPWFICGGVLVAIIGVIVAISIISYRSSLEYITKTVLDEYPRAHCEVSYTGMSVTIDTNPEDETSYDIYNMTTTELAVFQAIQSGSTNAIKLMNEKLGFDSDLHEIMGETRESMGEQTAENDNYRVKWSYSSRKGLEVTYYEK